jgi:hypothetical protein
MGPRRTARQAAPEAHTRVPQRRCATSTSTGLRPSTGRRTTRQGCQRRLRWHRGQQRARQCRRGRQRRRRRPRARRRPRLGHSRRLRGRKGRLEGGQRRCGQGASSARGGANGALVLATTEGGLTEGWRHVAAVAPTTVPAGAPAATTAPNARSGEAAAAA